MMDGKALAKKIGEFKYPILILLFGIILLLLPTGEGKPEDTENPNMALEEVLSASEGVGRIRILISDTGTVVVCDGAGNAAVRLDIIHAIGSYTGFGSDKITVLKMSN